MALKTINSFQLTPEWRYGGSTGKLRLYYSDNFVDNEGRPVVGGAVGSSGFYREVDITIASLVATVASFVLVTIEDSDHPNAKVTGVLYDSTGARRDTLFEWSVPPNGTVASPTTFAVMEAYNDRDHLINPPEFYLTQQQILAFINAALAAIGVTPATNLVLGIVKLNIAAADPANPSAWGTNDPLVRDALKLMGVSMDATMAAPANTNVPVFDSVSGTWKPGIGAQGAAGGALSGTYPNPSVVDDSHLHSIATLVGLGALAILSTVGTAQIDNDAVSYAKMQNISAASKLLGRGDSGAGDPQEITLGANLTMTGSTLSVAGAGLGDVVGPASSVADEIVLFDGTSGKLIKRAGQTGFLKGASGVISAQAQVALAADVSGDLPLANLAQASAASKLLGRGDSGAGDFQEIALGTNLSMSGATLNAAGGGSSPVTVAHLSGDVTNSTATAAKITGLDTVVGPGTYKFEYWIRYQVAATSTGVKFSINHTGTVTAFMAVLRYTTPATTSVSDTAAQDVAGANGSLYQAWARRAVSNTANMGPTANTDASGADTLTIIEGLLVVSVSGNIELWHASDVAADSTVKVGTSLILTQIA